jgi:glycosyltransferase involved in cell wall biosynthesis
MQARSTIEQAPLAVAAGDIAGAPQPQPAFRLHILQVLPSLGGGGVERGTVDVAAAVVKAGGKATVVSTGGAMVREVERAGAKHVAMPVDTKNPFEIWRNIGRLRALLETERVDLVHARSRAPAWSARAAARRAGVSFVTTFHGTYNFGNWVKKRYNAIMTRGDRVIAISEFIADHVRKNYHVGAERIEVIHRGIDLEIFSPQAVPVPRILALAQRWRLPDGVPVVMLPGRLTRWKGQTIFLEALARIGDAECMGVIVGGDQGRTSYRAELEDQIKALGLESRVRLVGDTNDMAAAFMLADVVVSASTDPEAFGRIIVEAQAMGRPVIAPNLGAAPETVIDGVTGWLVSPSDPAALASAIRKALGLNEEQRHAIAYAAENHVRAKFSKDTMCAKTLALYRAVVAARGRRAEGARRAEEARSR